jgi:sporulation protein YlmC with PRC-barrel domain
MRLTSARKRPVVDTSNATRIGKVAGAVVDARERRVTAVVVDGSDKGSLVSWEDAVGFGPDALTIASADNIRLPRDEREEAAVDGDLELLGKAVFDDSGDRLGKLRDVDFDPESGEVLSLVLDRDEEGVAGERLLGVGSYCVVVQATGR